ncbi:MAG: phage tail length tape measure family protein [Candidatus Odinarchaeota archaeon]|nr:phage tail length tape measure family protein [Candidatus Odinarchaeota archaeon]
MSLTPELYDVIVKIIEDKVKEIKVTREEFDRLRLTVDKLSENILKLNSSILALSEAQRRTEERLDRLSETVDKLAEAQRRTEERLNELAEAQRRTEERLDRLSETVDKLAEAQRRTEERLNELAEAQRRTEEQINRLSEAVRNLSVSVSRLSDTVGFGLEDIARVVVPGWLYRHESINIDSLDRKFFKIDAEEIEINLYGIGNKNGKRVVVIGECKSRIYRSDVEKFGSVVNRLKEIISDEIYALMFGYWIHPSAEEEAKKRKITLIASYMR